MIHSRHAPPPRELIWVLFAIAALILIAPAAVVAWAVHSWWQIGWAWSSAAGVVFDVVWVGLLLLYVKMRA